MKKALRYLVLLLALLIMAYPLLWMVMAAFRPEGQVLEHPFALPANLTLENLSAVWRTGIFGKAYVNSLLVCCIGVAATLACGAPAAYAFAQLRFRAAHALFLLFLLGMMIPIHVTLIPLNRLLGHAGLGLKGTLWALIGPYTGFALPITILILRGAFEGLPRDIMDAARIDGCGPWRTFLRVALPLVRPALATVIIFNFLTMWNEFAFALTLLDPSDPTLPLAIARFKGEHGIEITRVCAALSVVVLPMLLLYCVAQKHIIRGLTAGALKE